MLEDQIKQLFPQIEIARKSFLHAVSDLSVNQAAFKPSPDTWSILEITEHMVWAEQIGICGMFRAIEGLQENQPIWSGDSPNKGLTIEEIVAKTWQPKEQVPKVAEPRWGGTLDFWVQGLKNNAQLLIELEQKAQGVDLAAAIYPHPISGPMNVIQRLDFLRFHLERHEGQVVGVKRHEGFPI